MQVNFHIDHDGYRVWTSGRFANWLFRKLFRTEVTHVSGLVQCGRIVLHERPNKGEES